MNLEVVLGCVDVSLSVSIDFVACMGIVVGRAREIVESIHMIAIEEGRNHMIVCEYGTKWRRNFL